VRNRATLVNHRENGWVWAFGEYVIPAVMLGGLAAVVLVLLVGVLVEWIF
jgi:hypothetical protein